MSIQKRDIVITAGDMFYRLGVRSVSIDDICREMRMSKKTFYTFFDSKDRLVEHILQANLDYMAGKAEDVLAKNDFREWVAGFVKRKNKEKNDLRRVPQLVFDLKKYYPHQFEVYQTKAFEQEKRYILRFLELGMRDGYVRRNLDLENTATLFAKIYNDMVRDLEIMESRGINVVHLSHAAMDVFVRGVLSDEGFAIYKEKENKNEQ